MPSLSRSSAFQGPSLASRRASRCVRSLCRSRLTLGPLLLLVLACTAAATPAADVAGHWEGVIEVPGMSLAVLIDLTSNGQTWKGEISIPAQNAQDLPLTAIAVTGETIVFTIAGIPGEPTFNGLLAEEGTIIRGDFTQAGQTFPFTLRSTADPLHRARAALAGIDATIDSALVAWQTPGLALGVVLGDQVVMAEGYGYRDLEQQLPVTGETIFAIGSSTKAFTCFTLATLVDEGLLDWDDPVVDHIPWFQMYDEYATAHLTARDLVTHRSGMPRHDLAWYNNEEITRAELVARLRYLEPNHELRERWQYNNLMYLTAGYLIELLTGMSWEEAVRGRVLAPLEMLRSNFAVGESQQSDDFALPYREKDDQLQQIDFRVIDVMGPGGSINSCAAEMNHWMIVNLNGGRYAGRNLLSAPAVDELHTPQMVMPATPDSHEESHLSYALGWMVRTWRGHYQVFHGGNIDGFSALVTLFPNDRVGITVLSNRDADPLPGTISKVIADRVLGLETRDWLAEEGAEHGELEAYVDQGREQKERFRQKGTKPSRPLEEFAGRFQHPGYGVVEIIREGKNLVMILNGMRMPLEHWHYDVFVVAESPEEIIPEDLRAVFLGEATGYLDRLSMSLEPNVDPIVFERLPEARMFDPGFLTRLTGDYELPGQVITVTLEGSVLALRSGGQPALELVPRGHDEFALEGISQELRVRFALPEEGQATEMLLIQPGGVFTAARSPEPAETTE